MLVYSSCGMPSQGSWHTEISMDAPAPDEGTLSVRDQIVDMGCLMHSQGRFSFFYSSFSLISFFYSCPFFYNSIFLHFCF
jgi:hypothetical protein